MNTNLKFTVTNIVVLACLLFSINARAQASVDLELRTVYPANGQVIPFGDTVHIEMLIINHGPIDIINDTIMIDNDVLFGSGFIGDIPVGDTVTAYGIMQWMGDEDSVNVTMNTCYYFRNPVSFSNNVVDTNAVNDTACFSYILLGDTTTGIAAIQANKPLKLFPNPASGLVNIQLNTEGYRQLQLRVTDVFGREILFHDYATKNSFGKSDIQFDATGFSPGVYFVRLRADDKTFMSKLVVR